MKIQRSLGPLSLSQNYACMKGKPRTVFTKERSHVDSPKESPMGDKDLTEEFFFFQTDTFYSISVLFLKGHFKVNGLFIL